MNDEIIVKQKKLRLFIYILTSLFFTGICILFLLLYDRDMGEGLLELISSNDLTFYLFEMIMVLVMVFFLFATYFLVKKMIQNKPILVVDRKGVYDNATYFAVGFIPWSEIEGIYLGYQFNNEFIEVKLKNTDIFIEKLNFIQKRGIQGNHKLGHEHVCISLNATGIKVKDIIPEIELLFEKYK